MNKIDPDAQQVIGLGIAVFLILVGIGSCAKLACGSESIDTNRIADAIYKIEGGAKTKHPYGILAHYKTTTPRQACINTVNNQKVRHSKHKCGKDYLTCLRDRFAPLNAKNDPKNLNINWLPNLRTELRKGEK